MNLHLIDSTLREGLQTPNVAVFRDDESKLEYIDGISRLGLIDRFEVYMPGPHMSNETWQNITLNHRDKTQIYVGPAHKFDIDDREELLGSIWPMLSTTLIEKDEEGLTKLSEISEVTMNSPLRVGIECAGELDPAQTLELVQILGQTASVTVVSINDSNSRMSTDWLENFASELADHNDLIMPRLGFHLHNGEITALTKAQCLIESLGSIGIKNVELDVTSFGIGDRQGILSITEAISLSPQLNDDSIEAHEKIASKLVAKSSFETDCVLDSAVSHYDEHSDLRPEYLNN